MLLAKKLQETLLGIDTTSSEDPSSSEFRNIGYILRQHADTVIDIDKIVVSTGSRLRLFYIVVGSVIVIVLLVIVASEICDQDDKC